MRVRFPPSLLFYFKEASMQFRKPIWKKNKTYKRPYTRAKSVSYACRNHGFCDWCRGGRTFFDRKRRLAADAEIKYYLENLGEIEL